MRIQDSRFKIQSLRGFTLIETLVAVLLLATAIAGPLTIASKGLLAASVARDQITAFYLAQDAVEYIRYNRDSNKLQSASWLTGLENCISADGSTTCYMDSLATNPATPTVCTGTCPIMSYDSVNGYFNYPSTGGTPTPQRFTRTISITTPVGGRADEAEVRVTVSWQDNNPHSVTMRENIFNWQ